MKEIRKKVAIIGSGVTGLAAVKCCLEEDILPTCFERSNGVGGLWVYRDNADRQMVASVFKSTVTNPSKEAMCYSDFPFPKDWPNYLHNSYMRQYCSMYADKFGLKEYILFSTRVTRLAQSPDYEETGRWIVTTVDENDGREITHEFDAVMICTGMYNNPYVPEFPGLDEFKGRVLHSHDYRKPDKFEGKRVVVIGVGNSAGDAAADLSDRASQVFLSVRHGAWLISRPADSGSPTDLMFVRRFHWLPVKLDIMLYRKSVNRLYDLIAAPMRPSNNLSDCEPVTNEKLPDCILNGRVIIRPNVARFTETGVEFEDGTVEDNIDVVIMATGYRFRFPFEVECPVLETKQDRVPLYKLVFPLGLRHNTLSVNGAVTPIGPLIPCVELQARWAARVFRGLNQLPSQSEMAAEVKMANDGMQKKSLPPHRSFVEPISYMDSIASEIGVRPNFMKLFFTEPLLTLRCLFGPHVPFQYRLVGPGKWHGAREAISTVWERVLEPTKKGHTKHQKGHTFAVFVMFVGIVLLATISALLYMSVSFQ